MTKQVDTNGFLLAQAQPSQTIFTSQVPSLLNASDNGTNYELGMKFQSAKAGQITAVRYYKASSETGTHTGRIWSASGTLLASVTFSNETASGWQQQALGTPLLIQANTVYVISVNSNGYFVDTYDVLASSIANGDLSTVADGNDGMYGSSGSFPTGSYRNSNYFRDIVFIAGVPPIITKVSGDNQSGATGSALSNPLVVQVNSNTGNPQSGVTVSFAIVSGGGSVSPTSAITNSNGQASTVLTLGPTASVTNQVTATASGVGSVTFNAIAKPTGTNPIYAENQKAGTTAWQVTNWATNAEISGYAAATSINRGSSLPIYVSLATPGTYTIDVYRLGYYGGKGGRLLISSGLLQGTTQSAPTITDPATLLVTCNWLVSYTIAVGADWTTGLYIANLTDYGTGKQSQVWFVVRDDSSHSDVLFQSSFTTFQAYNMTGGYSLYAFNSIKGNAAYKVSFDRPFSEVTTSNYEYNNMLRWERNMVRWMESQGYDISYVTNIDVHANSQLLQQHKVYLSVGHDEYWSLEERNNVQQARDAGVNLGFFCGNSAYWRVRFENSSTGISNRVMVCYKYAWSDTEPTTEFRISPPNPPENALQGVMYTGDRDELYANTWSNSPTYGGYDFVVANSTHRYYANTNLKDGDTLSLLVGFEWDAVVNNGLTPSGLVILSQSPVNPSHVENSANLPPGTNTNISNAAAYTAASGAKVFATGSIQWVWGLDSDGVNPARQDIRVQQIAVNVLADMGAKPLTPNPNVVVPH